MVLMEDSADSCVRGGGDGQDGVAAGVDKESGLGDGVLHMVDGGDHLWGDSELLLGLGQGVCQGADNVGKAGKETVKKITHTE